MKKGFAAIFFILTMIVNFSYAEVRQEYLLAYEKPFALPEIVQKNIKTQFSHQEKILILVSFLNDPKTNFISFHRAYEIASMVEDFLPKHIRVTMKLEPQEDHVDQFKLELVAN